MKMTQSRSKTPAAGPAAWLSLLSAAMLLWSACPARGERIKDITDVKGVRGNPLQGVGLVTGLVGTGDSSPVSQRLAANIVRRMGLAVDISELTSKNIAVVMVTADLGPWAREGQTLGEVTVSALGSASSLQGGQLHMTPLKGADGQVYAVAAGAVVVGGFAATGQAGSVSKNHPTVGKIPGGAIVEREELGSFYDPDNREITLLVRYPDFATAQNIAEAINEAFPGSSDVLDAGAVRVSVPPEMPPAQIAHRLRLIGELEVTVDQPATVVINERTGTIIVGERVGISTVAITHGNLSIVTEERDFISQPAPFAKTGTTERIHRTDISVTEEYVPMVVVGRKPSVAELARALNAMGLTPRDIISIFQELQQAGALQAQLLTR